MRSSKPWRSTRSCLQRWGVCFACVLGLPRGRLHRAPLYSETTAALVFDVCSQDVPVKIPKNDAAR